MEIQYYVRQVYGNDTEYVLDEKIASALCRLSGNKTLTEKMKNALEQLGFSFIQVLK